MARTSRKEFRAFDYVARPRRKSRVREGVTQHYWTVRCRVKGPEGEWSIGWQSSSRQAEQAFHAWVAANHKKPIATDGSAPMVKVIDDYMAMVPTTSRRPRTKEIHLFRARKLRAFIVEHNASMAIGDFSETTFAAYLVWLDTVRNHSPQTIVSTLIGARTVLRWAETQGLATKTPKPPKYRVPAPRHEPLDEEQVTATIAQAEAPLNVMLQLLWETGMRVSEATSKRGIDLRPEENLVLVRTRDLFVPKTKESERTVQVTPETMAMLKQLVTSPLAPLFPCTVKRVYHFWRHRLRKAQKAAGVRHFTFQDIRRAVADRLRNGGVPMDQYAKFMGHAPVTALRHYSTVTDDDLHKALKVGLSAARTLNPKTDDGDKG